MNIQFQLGSVGVDTTHGRGHSPEYYADRFTDRMISISETVPEPLRLQALAFRDSIQKLSLDVIRRAVQSDRTTIIAALQREGMQDAANLVATLK